VGSMSQTYGAIFSLIFPSEYNPERAIILIGILVQ